MATLEELQQQLATLSARVDALTTPPDDYYTSKYSGEEIDAGIAKTESLPESWPLPIASGGTGADTAQQALANLGGRPGRNFADNSRFSDKQVVNQRGQTTYTNGVIDACISRWKLLGTMTLEANGIVVQKTQSAPEFLAQLLSDDVLTELRGRVVTLSAVYIDDGARKIQSTTFVVPEQGEIDSPEAAIGDVLFDLYKSSGDANARIRFFSGSPTTSVTLEAVELVIGDHQTIVYTDNNGELQFLDTPDYGAELVRCLNYFERIGNGSSPALTDAQFIPAGAQIVVFSIRYNHKRITTPTITFSPPDQYRVLLESLSGSLGEIGVTSISVVPGVFSDKMASVAVTLASQTSENCYGTLQRQDGSKSPWIDVSAEL